MTEIRDENRDGDSNNYPLKRCHMSIGNPKLAPGGPRTSETVAQRPMDLKYDPFSP